MMIRNAFLCGAVLALATAGALTASRNDDVVPGLNRFSSSLYDQLRKDGGANLVASPFSISNALSMVLAGARGGTAAEISRLLGGADLDYHAGFAAMVDRVSKAANTGGNQLLSANGLWVQQGFPILSEFRQVLLKNYGAPPSLLDFQRDPERSRDAINSWTDRNTHGKIQELFGPGDLDRRTRLVLTSAVYFYGKWEQPFKRTNTAPAPFTLASGSTGQADFMKQTGTFGYAEIPAGQVLEMRYAGTGLAFDVLLPGKGATLESMEMAAHPDRMAAWLGSLKNRTVRVEIPKFKVESEFPLAAVLARLGMTSAFNGAADFSGIDDRRDLQLSQVVHKAYIDVSEEGTEAAAATGAAVTLIASRTPEVPLFRADHPFPFLIRDTRTGLILFNGRLSDPRH